MKKMKPCAPWLSVAMGKNNITYTKEFVNWL